MNTIKLLGAVVLLTSVIPSCSGESPVTVLCSIDWFVVTVNPFLLSTDVYVHYTEVYLGQGCIVTHIQPYAYQFTYRVSECGIRAKVVSQEIIIYSSEVYYQSKGTSSKYVIPVSCVAPQNSPWLTAPWPVNEPSTSGATSENDEAPIPVFELSQSNERPVCDCPPCVFNEGGGATNHQSEAQEANSEASPYAMYFLEDWTLRSDDLIGSM
ncbi:placenta-specific protein 1 [Rhynchocyon petersi]